jgi:quercetin dioxygenase-like cupin family protein
VTRYLLLVAAIGIGCAISVNSIAPPIFAQDGTPAASVAAPIVIANEVLGRAQPAAVEEPELALGRVTIMPGAAIPVHYHPGTQIGVVVQGELTYTVFTGETAWYRAADPSADPYLIQPGETVVVPAGDAVVETPGAIHQGSNAGDEPLVIYLSTLFPTGAPRAVIVEATPVPG